jgi:HEPN domain-containing protein
MNPETRNYILTWLNKADEDLTVINRLTEDGIYAPSAICFHCQQMVEKLLKAYLIANGKEIRKTHNIEFLLSECSDFDESFKEIDPLNLSDFGVEVRYPGDNYVPGEEEALDYKKLAIEIRRFTLGKIMEILHKDLS